MGIDGKDEPWIQGAGNTWCAEKAGNVVEQLEQLHRLLAHQQLPAEVKDLVAARIRVAMWDATKLLCFGSGVRWTTDDADFVLNNGVDGYRMYADRHGVLRGTLNRTELSEFVEQLEALLDASDRTNRTRIHELLRRVRSNVAENPLVKLVGTRVEAVTQGELDWHDFVSGVRDAIEERRHEGSLTPVLPTPPKSWSESERSDKEPEAF